MMCLSEINWKWVLVALVCAATTGCDHAPAKQHTVKLIGPEGWGEDKALVHKTQATLAARIEYSGGQLGENGIQLDGDLLILDIETWISVHEVHRLLTMSGAPIMQRCLENEEVFPYFEKANEELVALHQTPAIEPDMEEKQAVDSSSHDLRLDTTATVREFEQANPLFRLLLPNIWQDGKEYYLNEGPIVGYANVDDTAVINDLLDEALSRNILPNYFEANWSLEAYDEEQQYVQLYALDNREGAMPLNGEAVKNARVTEDPFGNPEVSILLESSWGQEFARLTGDNIGRSLAITVNDKVVSAPRVAAAINGGRLAISGRFTVEETWVMCGLCASGALKVPLEVVN